MKEVSEMNRKELIAWKEVRSAFDWVIGGYENDVCDGDREEMPSYEDLVEEVYWTVMHYTTMSDAQFPKPRDKIRFAGKAFITECILHLMDTDSFQYEIKHKEVTK